MRLSNRNAKSIPQASRTLPHQPRSSVQFRYGNPALFGASSSSTSWKPTSPWNHNLEHKFDYSRPQRHDPNSIPVSALEFGCMSPSFRPRLPRPLSLVGVALRVLRQISRLNRQDCEWKWRYYRLSIYMGYANWQGGWRLAPGRWWCTKSKQFLVL